MIVVALEITHLYCKIVEGIRLSNVGKRHLVFYTFLGSKYIKSYAKIWKRKEKIRIILI